MVTGWCLSVLVVAFALLCGSSVEATSPEQRAFVLALTQYTAHQPLLQQFQSTTGATKFQTPCRPFCAARGIGNQWCNHITPLLTNLRDYLFDFLESGTPLPLEQFTGVMQQEALSYAEALRWLPVLVASTFDVEVPELLLSVELLGAQAPKLLQAVLGQVLPRKVLFSADVRIPPTKELVLEAQLVSEMLRDAMEPVACPASGLIGTAFNTRADVETAALAPLGFHYVVSSQQAMAALNRATSIVNVLCAASAPDPCYWKPLVAVVPSLAGAICFRLADGGVVVGRPPTSFNAMPLPSLFPFRTDSATTSSAGASTLAATTSSAASAATPPPVHLQLSSPPCKLTLASVMAAEQRELLKKLLGTDAELETPAALKAALSGWFVNKRLAKAGKVLAAEGADPEFLQGVIDAAKHKKKLAYPLVLYRPDADGDDMGMAATAAATAVPSKCPSRFIRSLVATMSPPEENAATELLLAEVKLRRAEEPAVPDWLVEVTKEPFDFARPGKQQVEIPTRVATPPSSGKEKKRKHRKHTKSATDSTGDTGGTTDIGSTESPAISSPPKSKKKHGRSDGKHEHKHEKHHHGGHRKHVTKSPKEKEEDLSSPPPPQQQQPLSENMLLLPDVARPLSPPSPLLKSVDNQQQAELLAAAATSPVTATALRRPPTPSRSPRLRLSSSGDLRISAPRPRVSLKLASRMARFQPTPEPTPPPQPVRLLGSRGIAPSIADKMAVFGDPSKAKAGKQGVIKEDASIPV